MDEAAFDYQIPTESQLEDMNEVRKAFRTLGGVLEAVLPEGPDKTYVLRTLRTCAMWSNATITKHPDGTPRK